MSARVRIREDDDGRLVAVKVPARPGDDERLVHEARLLAAAAHPGVVQLVSLGEREGQLELVTRWAGNRSLDQIAPLPPPAAGSVVAAVATIVADLHDLGLVHGRIEPSHVVLDDRGRPVLCGFAEAGPVGERHEGCEHRRAADDVLGLGQLLATALGPVAVDELVPQRRFGHRRSQHLHRDLLLVADRATVDDPSSRPTARAVAAAIHELLPSDAALPPAPDAEPPAAPPGSDAPPPTELEQQLDRLRQTAAGMRDEARAERVAAVRRAGTLLTRPRHIAAVLVVVSIGAIGALAVSGAANGARSQAAPASAPELDEPFAGSSSSVGEAAPSTTTTITTTTAASSTAPPDDGPVPTIEHAGRVYAVGEPGDSVAVGDWRCDGNDAAAVLRPATGDVFVFSGWAEPGADLVATGSARIDGAAELVPPGPEPCPPLRARLHDGSIVDVALEVSR